ncbi:Zinc finger CCHC domain-containing protein 8 [Fukomys damarensis]|uniref:Zinc finger CCHC domain-containing protein 8 n=1 Tax=Fukomys damarensis TaxID=885580 RepID=A0A091DLE6_FUKDA|nr:Zinc finger CCHC domain-containing protein 8 [Fukomys damarensis]
MATSKCTAVPAAAEKALLLSRKSIFIQMHHVQLFRDVSSEQGKHLEGQLEDTNQMTLHSAGRAQVACSLTSGLTGEQGEKNLETPLSPSEAGHLSSLPLTGAPPPTPVTGPRPRPQLQWWTRTHGLWGSTGSSKGGSEWHQNGESISSNWDLPVDTPLNGDSVSHHGRHGRAKVLGLPVPEEKQIEELVVEEPEAQTLTKTEQVEQPWSPAPEATLVCQKATTTEADAKALCTGRAMWGQTVSCHQEQRQPEAPACGHQPFSALNFTPQPRGAQTCNWNLAIQI